MARAEYDRVSQTDLSSGILKRRGQRGMKMRRTFLDPTVLRLSVLQTMSEVAKISQVRVMLPASPQIWNKNQKQPIRPVTKGIHKTWITP